MALQFYSSAQKVLKLKFRKDGESITTFAVHTLAIMIYKVIKKPSTRTLNGQPFKLTEITCTQRCKLDFELQLIKAIRHDL